MKNQDGKGRGYRRKGILLLSPYCSICLQGWTQQTSLKGVLANCICSFILALLFLVFSSIYREHCILKAEQERVVLGGIFLSFILLGIRGVADIGLLWLLGVVLASLYGNIVLAAGTYFFTMGQYGILYFGQEKDSYFMAYALLGAVMVLLLAQLRKRKELFYFAVILIAIQVTMEVVVYDFFIKAMAQNIWQIGNSLISTLLLLAVCFLCFREKEEILPVREETVEAKTEDVSAAKKDSIQKYQKDLPALQHVLEPDFPLMVRMQQYSMPLMVHSMRISRLSEGAAGELGGRTFLAKAGGLYHEIGRIEDEEHYIEAGEKLGREYEFPEVLLEVMRQHSTGFEAPKSIEAAIIMLSDCIVSTSEYLEKSEKRDMISDEHLVNSIFKNRVEKGNLKESGITQENLERLRKYYIENAFD